MVYDGTRAKVPNTDSVFPHAVSGATDMDYGQYYGFSRMPFGEGPDREVFFPSETHKEALASMLFGIKERKGYIVIFGGQGMGKTMLIRQVMDQLGEGTRVALIEKAHDRYYALLKELMKQLGLRTEESSKARNRPRAPCCTSSTNT